MIKKMITRVAFALALLVATMGTTTLNAATVDRVAPQAVVSGAEEGPTVRVINNHGRNVIVYAVDSDNRRHLLGRVGPAKIKELQIPSGLVRETDTVQLKVLPALGAPGLDATAFEPPGIKTSEFSVRSDQVIEFFLEPDLTRSVVGIASS